MRVLQEIILSTQSAAGNLTSSNIQLQQEDKVSIGCVITSSSGPLIGTLTVQGSADGINFTPLQISGTNLTLSVSGNGTYLFDIISTGCQFVNVTWANSSGTGNLTITCYVKEI